MIALLPILAGFIEHGVRRLRFPSAVHSQLPIYSMASLPLRTFLCTTNDLIR